MAQEVLTVTATSTPDNWALGAGASKQVAVQTSNGDTSYIRSTTTINTVEQFDLSTPSVITSSDTINFVRVEAECKRGASGSGFTYRTSVVRNGTTDGASKTAGGSYVVTSDDFSTRPAGGAWTLTDLQNLEIKITNTAAKDIRCTFLRVIVDYTVPPIPNPPSDLTATAVSTSQINLGWADNSNNETGFEIERSDDGVSGWAQINAPAANAVSYNNTGLTPSTAYYYRVRAVGSSGSSAWSNTASATTAGSSGGSRGIGFNGSNQNLTTTIPAVAAYGDFSVEARLRNLKASNGRAIHWDGQFIINASTNLITYYFYEEGVFHDLTTTFGNDGLVRVQFDPANTRWTVEAWDNDGTGHVQATVTSASSTRSVTGNTIGLGSGAFGTEYAQVSIDYFRILDLAPGLNVTPSEVVVSTYYSRLEFEDSHVDAVGTFTWTPSNNPTYNNTPGGTGQIDPPINITAHGRDTVVDLWWEPVVGATGYTVKRSTTAGSGYTQVATGIQTTQYADEGLANNTTYYYVLVTSDATSTSVDSSEVSATTTIAGQPNIPTEYGWRTDRASVSVPSMTGALDLTLPGRGTNYTFNDPNFGATIVRITDRSFDSEYPLAVFRTPDSAEQCSWNRDSSMLVLAGQGGTMYPVKWNTSTRQCRRVGSASNEGGGIRFFGYSFPCWSFRNPNVFYAADVSAGIVNRIDFTDITDSSLQADVRIDTVISLDVVQQAVFGTAFTPYCGEVGISGNQTGDEYATLCWGGGGGQDTFALVVHYNLATGTFKVLDVSDGTNLRVWDDGVWTNTSPTTAAWGDSIHNVRIDKSGRFIRITRVNPPTGDSGVAIWDTTANTVKFLTNASATPTPGSMVGHLVQGFGMMINMGAGPGPDEGQWWLRDELNNPNDATALINPLLSEPGSVPQYTDTGRIEDHTSWANAKPGVLTPVLSSTIRLFGNNPGAFEWRAWDNEILLIRTDGTSEVWRVCHHFSTTWNDAGATPVIGFDDWVFANVSQDGRWASFSSNMGMTMEDTNGNRVNEVFVVDLVSSDIPTPTSPSVKLIAVSM